MKQKQIETMQTEVQNTTEDRLLTRKEAASLLRLRPQTLAKWSMTGKHLPVVHIGGSVRYRHSDVQQLIRRGTSSDGA